MATPKREQFANNAVDALDGAIDDTVTTLDVVDASAFPTDGNFRILIDSEIMLVTAVSTNTFTVVRGQEGTLAASHSDAAPVTHLLTKSAFERALFDNVPHVHSGIVPYGIFNTSGQRITSASFTWDNQVNATVNDYDNYISLNDVTGGGAHFIRGMYISAPGSTPWSVVACVHGWAKGVSNGDIKWGIFLRESSTGKIITYEFTSVTNVRREYWTNSTTTATTNATAAGTYFTCRWLKITDDGTDLKFYISSNGMNWAQTVTSVGRTAHMSGGPDQAGFHINRFNNSGYLAGLDLLHWSFQ